MGLSWAPKWCQDCSGLSQSVLGEIRTFFPGMWNIADYKKKVHLHSANLTSEAPGERAFMRQEMFSALRNGKLSQGFDKHLLDSQVHCKS